MFREIRTRERITDVCVKVEMKENEGFRKIKPEHEHTKEELDQFIMDIFEQARLEALAEMA